MLDCIIRGGTVVDGTGAIPRTGDVGIQDGLIVALGERLTQRARREIDADGCVVAPGWIDIHTHYDGQVAWDDKLEPSAAHGVTTVVMGNCGVGFAPVRQDAADALIEIMEGVEDIPGTALHAGIPWGAWQTFPEYLNYLAGRQYAVDIGAQVPHSAVRFYTMGQRGADHQLASSEESAAMAQIVEEGVRAGALGFSTSRTIIHHSTKGEAIPGTFADEPELQAIAKALQRTGRGVIEVIPAGVAGSLEPTGSDEARPTRHVGGEHHTLSDELQLMRRLSLVSGGPVTFTTVQRGGDPQEWRRTLDFCNDANQQGAALRPQFASRGTGIITGLTGYHLFMKRPGYLKLAQLPLAQRVAQMRTPAVKEEILRERGTLDARHAGPEDIALNLFEPLLDHTFRMADPIDYEPTAAQSVAQMARAQGRDPVEFMYDMLLENDGLAFATALSFNYPAYSLDHCATMFGSPAAVLGLGDAGAHVNFICDMSLPTFQLTHWVRDRTRGPRLPLAAVIAKQTRDNALLYGLTDRGALQAGLRADINVIDLERLKIDVPVMYHDLPSGGSRIMQHARGYVATLVAGAITRVQDQDTGARPGRLVRGH